MKRFFTDMTVDDHAFVDAEGLLFANLADARAEVLAALPDLTRDELLGRTDLAIEIAIRDEGGTIRAVSTLKIESAVLETAAG